MRYFGKMHRNLIPPGQAHVLVHDLDVVIQEAGVEMASIHFCDMICRLVFMC